MKPLTNEIELIKEAYVALSRNDIPGFIKIMDPDIERVEFPDSPQGGTYRGIKDVTTHVKTGRSQWIEGSCEPESFKAEGTRVLVYVKVHVRMKNATEWIGARVFDAFNFRNGKVTQFHSYTTEQQGLDFLKAK